MRRYELTDMTKLKQYNLCWILFITRLVYVYKYITVHILFIVFFGNVSEPIEFDVASVTGFHYIIACDISSKYVKFKNQRRCGF